MRSCDRAGKKKSYYSDSGAVSCPSCGAEVELKTQQAICPYCGGILQSDFYDWQTEAFEIYEPVGEQTKRTLLLLAASMALFLCVFLCLWLIPADFSRKGNARPAARISSPMKKGCCSFCGYRLGGGSARWKMI